VIGVRADAAGLGIGTGLLRHAKDWAAAHGLHRLELTMAVILPAPAKPVQVDAAEP
jgi:GNAT superfamily N-acetyltransferase